MGPTCANPYGYANGPVANTKLTTVAEASNGESGINGLAPADPLYLSEPFISDEVPLDFNICWCYSDESDTNLGRLVALSSSKSGCGVAIFKL